MPNIKRNILYRLLYEILLIAAPMITTPYISRILGPEGIGKYSFIMSLVTYFTIISALGTTTYGAREISRFRDEKKQLSITFWGIEVMTIIVSFTCLLIWVVIAVKSGEDFWFYLSLSALILASMLDISWLYIGIERIGYTVIINSIFKIIGIASIFIFVRCKRDLLAFFLINALISLFSNISMWFFLPLIVEKVNLEWTDIGRHFRQSFKYFIPNIAISIYTVFDKTLIGLLCSDKFENGYYEQACKVINIAKVFCFSAMNTVCGPRMSYLYEKKNISELKKRINNSLDVILLFSMGACVGIALISKEFVPLFFGSGYERVSILLICMSPLLIIIGVSNCIGNQYIVPSGRVNSASIMVSIGAFLNLISNLVLIPFFGSLGAVFGTLIAETCITVMFLCYAKEIIDFTSQTRMLLNRFITCIAMCIVIKMFDHIYFLRSQILVVSIAEKVILGALIYLLLLLFVFKDTTIKNIVSFLNHKLLSLVRNKK